MPWGLAGKETKRVALLARAVADDDDPRRIVGVLLHAGRVEPHDIGWIR